MPRITNSARQTVRLEAERFLAEYGFTTPPLPPDEALAARRLEVTPFSLDDLLVKANLPPAEQIKIQAMLNINEMSITFREDLPPQKQSWGKLHEVGHEFLPWHRQLFYYCPLLWLPADIQTQLEAEADTFAAEAFFFGSKFDDYARKGEFGLITAKTLADTIYGTSYHATFAHFVKQSDIPCCLIVWSPVETNNDGVQHVQLKLHYYVPSRSFSGHISPGITIEDKDLVGLLTGSSLEVVKHKVKVKGVNGETYTLDAESFSNSYNVFTLLFQPK
jgi:hypothetical protein